jgi:hypothetical protein
MTKAPTSLSSGSAECRRLPGEEALGASHSRSTSEAMRLRRTRKRTARSAQRRARKRRTLWLAALRFALRCCFALGFEGCGSADLFAQRDEEGLPGAGTARCRCGRRSGELSLAASCHEEIILWCAPHRRIFSVTSTFQAPSRAARRRWRDAQARKASFAFASVEAASSEPSSATTTFWKSELCDLTKQE